MRRFFDELENAETFAETQNVKPENFRNTDFKVVSDVAVTDFTDATFQSRKKSASNIPNQ